MRRTSVEKSRWSPMVTRLIKRLALSAVASRVVPPENAIARFQELARLQQLLRQLRINCILDVGANRGQFAEEVRQSGYTGLIVSFEPIAREFDRLHGRFSSDPAWRGYHTALGDDDTSAEIQINPQMTVMSSLLAPVNQNQVLEAEQVTIRRLDDVIEECLRTISEPRVFLKMDTQGFDLEVFKGARESLKYIYGLQSELSIQPIYHGMPHYLEALSEYERNDFSVFNFSVVNRTEDGALLEINCLMRRGEHRDAGSK